MINSTKLLILNPLFSSKISSKKLFRFLFLENNSKLNSDAQANQFTNLNFFLFWKFCKFFYFFDEITISSNYPVSLGTVLLLNNVDLFSYFFIKLFNKFSLNLLQVSFSQKVKLKFLSSKLSTNFWYFLEFCLFSSFFFQYFLGLNFLINKFFFHLKSKMLSSKINFLSYSISSFLQVSIFQSRGHILIRFYSFFLFFLI